MTQSKREFTPPRKPDFEMVTLIKGTKISQVVGVAWLNEESGNLHVTFQPFTDINAIRDLGPAAVTTLFDRRKESPR